VAAVVRGVAVADASCRRDRLYDRVTGGGKAGGGYRDLARVGFESLEQFVEGLVRRVGVYRDDAGVGDAEVEMPVFNAGVEHVEHGVGAKVTHGAGGPGVTVEICVEGV